LPKELFVNVGIKSDEYFAEFLGLFRDKLIFGWRVS